MLAGALAGSAAALVRQPGVAIPVAVLFALVATGRVRANAAGLLLAAKVVALPAITYGGYYLWLSRIHGETTMQTLMRSQLFEGGWAAVRHHAEQVGAFEVGYIGLFVLPLVLGAAVGLPGALRSLSVPSWLAIGAWEALLIGGFASMRAMDLRMPYVPHFLSASGLGPNDLLWGRWPLLGPAALGILTLVCVLSTLIAGVFVIAAIRGRVGSALAIVLAMLVSQAVMTFVVSTHFRFWSIDGVPTPSLDRYMLPLMPLAIAAILWAVRDAAFSLPLAGYATLAVAAFAVAGTRDNIVFHQATWDLARATRDSGVPALQLDAGASWSGYHLGEQSYEQVGIVVAPDRRWWLGLFAGAIDPQYVISGAEHHGYTTLREYPYDLWLDTRPGRLYLLKRDEVLSEEVLKVAP